MMLCVLRLPNLIDWVVRAAPPEVKENESGTEESGEDIGEVVERKRKKKKVGFHDRKVNIKLKCTHRHTHT